MCNETPTPRIDSQGRDLSAPAVYVLQRGMGGFAWACAPKSFSRDKVEKTLDAIGEIYCPGTPWTVAPREHSDPVWQSPGRCDQDSDRQHWLLLGGVTSVVLISMGAVGEPDENDDYGFPAGLELR